MNFVPQSLIELARGNRLFVGAVEAGTPKVGYELASASYVFTKVSAGDVVEALSAIPWVSGRRYDKVGQGPDALVVNTARQVFVCMFAPANNESTSEPNRVEAREVEGADGYVWRYLFTVTHALSEKFGWSGLVPLTPSVLDHSPVTVFDLDTGVDAAIANPRLSIYPSASGVEPRAVVENGAIATITVPYGKIAAKRRVWVKVEAADTAGQGAVLDVAFQAGVMSVSVASQGTDYSSSAVVTLVGNGSGGRVAITVSAGKIIAAEVIEQGTGYTWADAIVTDGVGSGVAHPLNLDYATQLGTSKTVITKSIPVLDEGSSTPLDLHFFIAETPETAVRVRGTKGSMLLGVESQTRFHFLAECKANAFRLDQEMLINTVITSG
jgi:hypothetical protein